MAFVIKVFTFKNWHQPIWEMMWTFHCESIYSKFLIYMCHHEDYNTLLSIMKLVPMSTAYLLFQVQFYSQRKAMPKNAQTTTQLHSSHTLVK